MVWLFINYIDFFNICMLNGQNVSEQTIFCKTLSMYIHSTQINNLIDWLSISEGRLEIKPYTNISDLSDDDDDILQLQIFKDEKKPQYVFLFYIYKKHRL